LPTLAEAKEAIAEWDPENAETGLEIASNNIPGNADAFTGEEVCIEYSGAEESTSKEKAQLLPSILQIPQKQAKRDQWPTTCSSKSQGLQEERTVASQEYLQHLQTSQNWSEQYRWNYKPTVLA